MGRSLATDKELRVPVNPFGINSSPYGEVLAMAMQGSIDTYWHSGIEQSASADGHDHDHDHDHDHEHSHEHPEPAKPAGLRGHVLALLEGLEKASAERTNPKPPSNAQKFNIRRQIEDKLRFAYDLDPAHYGNYNSYHFFLTEPELGTRPQLTPQAAKLADKTIRYCLEKYDDPRPALTAAAASSNLLELMFNDRAAGGMRFTTPVMREYLQLMDHSIQRYRHISSIWKTAGQWDLLSPQRQLEAEERLTFTLKVRDAAEGTIRRLEQEERAPVPLLPPAN